MAPCSDQWFKRAERVATRRIEPDGRTPCVVGMKSVAVTQIDLTAPPWPENQRKFRRQHLVATVSGIGVQIGVDRKIVGIGPQTLNGPKPGGPARFILQPQGHTALRDAVLTHRRPDVALTRAIQANRV